MLKGLGQQVGNGTRGCPQAHPPGQALDLATHFVQRQVGIGQQTPGPTQQRLADGRRAHLVAVARQQRRTDPRLQLGHVQADGGRREVELAGGFGKRAQVGNHYQGTQAVEADFAHGRRSLIHES